MDRTTYKNLGLQPLDLQFRREVKKHLWWSRFKGNIKEGRDYSNNPTLQASGSPIEVNPNLQSIGHGDRLLIPMERDLAGAPTLGDAVLIGREEPSSRAFAKTGYNQVRHAIPVKLGKMDEMREKAFRAAESNMQKLAYWHAQYENYNIVSAIYEGASENLYTTTNNTAYGPGLGIPRRFHPNLYTYSGTSGSEALTKVGSAGKFPSATEVYNAAASTSNPKAFDTIAVKLLVKLAKKRGMIPLVTEDGSSFYPVLLTLEQAYTLMQDDVFVKAAQSYAWGKLKDHPWVVGAIGYYEGCVFFSDIVSVRGFSGTATTLNVLGTVSLVADDNLKQNPRFLPQEGHITISNKENHVAILFGQSFLGEALHEPLAFRTEEADYGNWQGIGGATVYGYERLDFVPQKHVQYLEGTEAQVASNITNVYNKSSMLLMTWQ